MKKIAGMLITVLIIIFGICGCATGDGGGVFSDASKEDARDSYLCVVNTQLVAERGEEEAGNGKSSSFLGDGRAFRFIDYFLGNRNESYTEIVAADSKGGLHSWKSPFGENGYIVGAGHIAGSDGFATLLFQYVESEEAKYQYSIEKRSANGDIVDSIALEYLSSSEYSEVAETVAVDIDGYIHMAGASGVDSRMDYQVVSPRGELLRAKPFEQCSFVRLITLPDGRIACDFREHKDGGQYHHWVEWTNTRTGEEELLFEYDESSEDGKDRIQAVNVFDEERLIYANAEGVFLCDYSFRERNRICTWSKQGIAQALVDQISATQDGAISVLLNTQRGIFFLFLEPAPDKVYEIELATAHGATIYYEAVAQFNKRHPQYNIVIREDYDRTALLTKLMAGDGPVLVGSDLVPFAEQKKLWEPLDTVYEKSGILDELNSAAVRLASIDGLLYGVVSDFYLTTLATGAAEADWDYDTFVKCVENSGELQYIVDNALGESNVWIALSLFDNGREDSFYVNADGEPEFDTQEFRKVLNLIDTYGPDSASVPYVEGLQEGRVLCNYIQIFHPQDLIFYRDTYGDGVKLTGFPSVDGARNRLQSSHILAMRKTASETEKEIATEFMKLLLSYDTQLTMSKDDNFLLSVRTDVLSEQINSVSEGTLLSAPCFDRSFYLDEPDNEKNRKELLELIEKSVPCHESSDRYRDILEEEFENYFSGEITADMLIERLSNRVGLFFEETE